MMTIYCFCNIIEDKNMCYNCGCLLPKDNMGSENNITDKTFSEMARKKNKDIVTVQHEVLHMLESDKITDADVEAMFGTASKVWGQSVIEAKQNTKELLKQVLKHKDHQ
jgi:hypothetical protein